MRVIQFSVQNKRFRAASPTQCAINATTTRVSEPQSRHRASCRESNRTTVSHSGEGVKRVMFRYVGNSEDCDCDGVFVIAHHLIRPLWFGASGGEDALARDLGKKPSINNTQPGSRHLFLRTTSRCVIFSPNFRQTVGAHSLFTFAMVCTCAKQVQKCSSYQAF